tara:strand:- start:91 stop:234 length:144 start_codon:yes stop_codon:yes gene_type:complete
MLVLNIAEWIANLFILGIAGMLWIMIVMGCMVIFSIVNKAVKEFTND